MYNRTGRFSLQRSFILVLILAIVLVLAGVTFSSIGTRPETLVLATTTSVADSGLLDRLDSYYEERYSVKIKVIAVGTGQALEYGKRGDADLVIVHSKPLEEKFTAEGFGLHRIGLMFNDFILVGPDSDPANVKGSLTTEEAFLNIKTAGDRGLTKFVSRGDLSGTHVRELEVWRKLELAPSGSWYVEAGAGMGATLLVAREKSAYTLTDRGTYLRFKDTLDLVPLFEGTKDLLNPYAGILVSQKLHPHVKTKLASEFIAFLVSVEGQELIKQFAVEGETLFQPLAKDIPLAGELGFPKQEQELEYFVQYAQTPMS